MEHFDQEDQAGELQLNVDQLSSVGSSIAGSDHGSDDDGSLDEPSVGSDDEDTCSESKHEYRKVVLVTGGAGFIGSHVAMALLERGDKVVVIDEVNDYYDVEIKRSNLALLSEKGARVDSERDFHDASSTSSKEAGDRRSFVFVEGDICDRDLLSSIFDTYALTHVCHLAARAGVRPSIDDPFIYVQSNVMGTVSLLELAARNGITNFVYASSSSVYGGSEKEKFSEQDVVDEPVSQYAASKKSCELFAATYNSLYGLNCTGLRFFTVYGERGRPDMAPYKFVHRVCNGITIDVYGDGSSERDYTYIGDITNGVVLALDQPLGNQVLNLGRGTPVNLSTFIATVERLCGRKAIINRMPMQPGDVPRTSCDTSKAKELIGYEAKMPLESGLYKTVQWYKDFHNL